MSYCKVHTSVLYLWVWNKLPGSNMEELKAECKKHFIWRPLYCQVSC